MTVTAASLDTRCVEIAVRRYLRKHHVLPMLVSHPVHVHYLTGFTGDATHLLLGEDRDLLVSDFRFRDQLAEECPDVETVIRAVETTLWEATAQRIGQFRARASRV